MTFPRINNRKMAPAMSSTDARANGDGWRDLPPARYSMSHRLIPNYPLRNGGQGYVGQGLDIADLLAVLYFHEMRQDPTRPQALGRDRLVMASADPLPCSRDDRHPILQFHRHGPISYFRLNPPSGRRSCPVKKFASSDAKNKIAFAISSGLPILLR